MIIGIPVYNRAELFRECLLSLSTQTDKDFDIIVYDDCSTENIKEICDEFLQLNIYYFRNKSNLGIAQTRQKIVDYAISHNKKYLMFIDADDLLMPLAVQQLKTKISSENYDIVYSNIIQQVDISTEIIENNKSLTWTHGKIYSVDFLNKHQIKFPSNIKTNEDLAFNLVCASYADKVGQIDENTYFWRESKDSITRKKDMTSWRCLSEDYIKAMYFAYQNSSKISNILKNSIICCYEYYQRILISKSSTTEVDKLLQRMMRNPEIVNAAIGLHKSTYKMTFKQWENYENSIIFYPQTYGVWINQFITKDRAEEALRRFNKEKENEDSSN